jgi:hypothetical protein
MTGLGRPMKNLDQFSLRLAAVAVVMLLASAALLVVGAAAVGGGHGVYWPWFLGLGVAVVASAMTMWCFVLRLQVVARTRSPDTVSVLIILAGLVVLGFWLSGIWR